MQPTFNPRWPESTDAVLLDKWAARRQHYCRGDVVVVKSPTTPHELMTKRVVGLGGDWVYQRGSKQEMLHVILPPFRAPIVPSPVVVWHEWYALLETTGTGRPHLD